MSLSKPRILLIKLSSLGDVIHALPTLEALRSLYPRGHITWLVEDTNAPLLAGHPALDEVWPVPRPRWGNGRLVTDLQETSRPPAASGKSLSIWSSICRASQERLLGGPGPGWTEAGL